jgi:hypothetical protein
MRTWGWRLARATFMGIVAWFLYQVLDHFDRAWLFLPIVGLVFFSWVAEQARRVYVRRRKEADWDRWEAAVGKPEARPAAIAEVRAALERSRRFGDRLRQEQAHLSVVLAELLEANGRAEEASRVLAKVDLDNLTPAQAVVVRHAKIVAYLSAGSLDDAEAALEVRAKDSGEPDMDARLDLLGAMIRIERGDAAKALETADEVEKRFEADPGLRAEARVVRAAALDAKGHREDAIGVMKTLDAATLSSLEMLGPPRVKPLAADARKGAEAAEA